MTQQYWLGKAKPKSVFRSTRNISVKWLLEFKPKKLFHGILPACLIPSVKHSRKLAPATALILLQKHFYIVRVRKTFDILINIQCLQYCLTFYPSLPWPSVKVLPLSVNRLQYSFHLPVYIASNYSKSHGCRLHQTI